MAMLTANEVMNVYISMQKMLEKIISFRTGSQPVGQDLSQELYFKVINMAREFSTSDDTRNYLIRMAINSAIDYRRVESRRSQLLEGAVALFEGPQSLPEHNTALEEEMVQIENAMNLLPEKSRQVLYLSRIEGMTHEEIAITLGISRSSIEKHIVRALGHCRDSLV